MPATAELARAKTWAAVRAQAENLLARLARREFDPDEPRDDQGQWTSGGGGDGGGQLELFPDLPPLPPPKKDSEIEDFAKDNVRLDTETRTDDAKGNKFIDQWNGHIGQAPAEFKKQFLGGVNGTMGIHYDAREDAITINGKLLDADGSAIGDYTREIDFDDNKASSSYFKLYSGKTGAGVGKQILAANVALYQHLGLDSVEVHANIDVGGYAWAKYGYVPTEDSWQSLSSDINNKIDELAGGSTGTPDSWDELSESQQDDIFEKWKDATRDDFYDSEISSWRDSGGDLAEAKSDLAGTFDTFSEATSKWAYDGLRGYAITVGEGADMKAVPLGKFLSDKGSSIDAVLADTTVEFNDRRGDGEDDPEITINAAKTPELTDDQRHDIESMLAEVFNKEAESRRDAVEPPDHVADNVEQYQHDAWQDMRAREKFSWAQDNDALPEHDQTGGEIDQDDAETLRDLANSDDPKAIWAIADSAHGKDLLLGTDWNGVLDLHDRETMERFDAYVGKKRAAA